MLYLFLHMGTLVHTHNPQWLIQILSSRTFPMAKLSLFDPGFPSHLNWGRSFLILWSLTSPLSIPGMKYYFLSHSIPVALLTGLPTSACK